MSVKDENFPRAQGVLRDKFGLIFFWLLCFGSHRRISNWLMVSFGCPDLKGPNSLRGSPGRVKGRHFPTLMLKIEVSQMALCVAAQGKTKESQQVLGPFIPRKGLFGGQVSTATCTLPPFDTCQVQNTKRAFWVRRGPSCLLKKSRLSRGEGLTFRKAVTSERPPLVQPAS